MKKTLYRVQLSLVALFTFFAFQSLATNYYVDPSSTATTANGTLLYPWKTIAQVNAGTTGLNPGDTVFFKRGQIYSGRLTVGRSGSASAPIVYTNYGAGTLPEFNNNISGIINLSGRQYVIIDGIKIIDKSISETDHTVQANISYAININNSPNCTIRNCDISRVGVGISVTTGSDFTTITGNYMHNMRMVRNTPTTINSNDDYGANPMVIGSSNNLITNNRFEECWALSYDYGYDGGAVELFGTTMNNNKIMYNTAINCNGFMEIGSSTNGSALNNIIAYNKIINCGIIGVYQNASTFMVTVNNLQYYNNTVVETVKQYSKPSAMFWMAGTGTAGMVTLKNNIFWLSSGVNFVGSKFTSGQIIHTNNIYRMSSGILGYTLNSNELFSTTANHFTSTTGDPSAWDYKLLSTSPAINFGTNVGLTKDFVGASISGNPDAGMLEYVSPVVVNPLVASANAGTISCNGGTTSVVVSATGGTTPYTGTGTFRVSAGTYNYIVSDSGGLKDTVSVTISQPAALTSSLSADLINVNGGTTSITTTAGGGTSPYTYSLDAGSYQSSNVFSGVLAGTHTVVVKDSKGCTLTKSITINQPPVFVASISAGTISCNGGTTSVVVSATGGVAPYSGTGNFTVSAGTYNYIISDASGLKDTVSVTVVQPAALSSSLSSGSITVNGEKTSVTVNAAGGTSPYSYSLNAGSFQSSNIFSGVAAGTNTIVVKDSRGCTISKIINITQPSVFIASASSGNISCNGGNTSIVVSATGGIAPYTGTGTFTVSAGAYTYIVSDAGGAKDTLSVNIVQPALLDAVLTSGMISVYGGSTSVTVNAIGGTAPYLFNLNNGTYQTSNLFSGVLAGTYNIGIKDNNGCIINRNINITQPAYVAKIDPLVASISAGNITCNGSSTTVTITASGGVQPYSGTGIFTVTAGTYDYVVSDASGLKDTVGVIISQPDILKSSISSGTILVSGGTTAITVNASGGTYPYQYSLDGGMFQTSNVFNNVYSGSHTVVTRDINNCSLSSSLTISDYIQSSTTQVKFNIKVFPNPTTNYFTLTVSNYHKSFPAYLMVYDSYNTLVYYAQGTSYSTFTFGSNFIPGTYYARVKVGATTKTAKIVKL